ncbi:hypothetical protein AMJ40_07055 [candidate division TA06 bacterium DG_26]|uniref:Uncharacterized protein n=1 Tax=candidate division TA06 bacterium DG_26 TaxID=1703771 RepID=A0A0S7WEW2_UNCT6|nr:MAG: hypothetical protein AMJ40_07055 [candidate division TA06 bacterium DG_26]
MGLDKSSIVKKIFDQPDEIESGLRMVDKDVKIADYGSIDIIGVDSSKALVLIQVGLDDSPQILLDALGCLDWVLRNGDIVRRLYDSSDVNCSRRPRVFVMTPHLSGLFLRMSAYFSPLELDLFEYSYVPSLDGLVVQKVDRERFRPARAEDRAVTQVVKPLYFRLKEILEERFARLEIFEIGPVSLIASDDRILARVSFTEDFLVIDMPPDGILEIKDESGLENVLSVLETRAEKFGIALKENPKDSNPSLPSLTEEELQALGGTGGNKEPDAPYLAETEIE